MPAEIYARFNDPIIVLLQLSSTPLSKLNVGCKTEVREQKGSLQNLMWVLYLKHQVINNVWCTEISVIRLRFQQSKSFKTFALFCTSVLLNL